MQRSIVPLVHSSRSSSRRRLRCSGSPDAAIHHHLIMNRRHRRMTTTTTTESWNTSIVYANTTRISRRISSAASSTITLYNRRLSSSSSSRIQRYTTSRRTYSIFIPTTTTTTTTVTWPRIQQQQQNRCVSGIQNDPTTTTASSTTDDSIPPLPVATLSQNTTTATNAAASRSSVFAGILSKIGTTENDFHYLEDPIPSSSSSSATSQILDWDRDILGETKLTNSSINAGTAVTASSDPNDNNDEAFRLQQARISEVNEIRQQDILKWQSKTLRKWYQYRKKQYSIYETTEQAMAAAHQYANETNGSTMEEIQNWIPYTEKDVKELFVTSYRQKTEFKVRDMKLFTDQYHQAIYNTSILVIPASPHSTTTTTKTATAGNQHLPAITNYPKSSLKLITLLKGMHNSTNVLTHPIESSFIKFMLHRNINQQKNTTTSSNSGIDTNDNTHETPVSSESADTTMIVSGDDSSTVPLSASAFGRFTEQQQDEEVLEEEDHVVSIDNSTEWNDGIVFQIHEERASMVKPTEQLYNYYHQSYDEYIRMMDVLERIRESIYVEHKRRAKRKKITSQYVKKTEKTVHMTSHLANSLPNVLFINLIGFFNDLCTSIQNTNAIERRTVIIKSIRNVRLNAVIDKFYYHSISPQLSDYLFQHDGVDDDDDDDDVVDSENRAIPSAAGASDKSAAIYNYYSAQVYSAQTYKGCMSSLEYFESIQSNFVTLFMDIQSILYNGSRVIAMDEGDDACKKIRKAIKEDSSSVSTEQHLSDTNNCNIDIDAIEDKLQITTSTESICNTDDDENSMDENTTNTKQIKKSTKITNEMVDSMDESSIRPVGFRKRKVEKEIIPVAHLAFEAISLELHFQKIYTSNSPALSDTDSSLSIADDDHTTHINGHSGHSINGSSIAPAKHNLFVTETSSPYSRMVFIDNLPIDICPEQINEVYVRCGEIESVEIFNQRPDLDPGSLSKIEVMKRRAKQTRVNLSARSWSRPKTPVYGLLTFADDAGYKKATDESLRIFGMIIQRHPVRSIPSWCLNTLYIDDVPGGHPCVDLEYQLSFTLEPKNIFVCLNAGQNYVSTVGSCEIKFPTFEIAYESYKHLQQKLHIFENCGNHTPTTTKDTQVTPTTPTDPASTTTSTSDNQCRINWIASQKDAHKWWTRQYGFD